MTNIKWSIENVDDSDAIITSHNDFILGAKTDDRYGEYDGTIDDYNAIVHALLKRVFEFKSEVYSAVFYDGKEVFLQVNIGYNKVSSIKKL